MNLDSKSIPNHIWIFGYGSLIWRPNFVYSERLVGFIDGFERGFWQGSVHHRGSLDRPGRVATLTEKAGGRVWGVCFKVQGVKNIGAALRHLQIREKHYETKVLEFKQDETRDTNREIFAIVFYAAPVNEYYLGKATSMEIANDIFFAYGVCGSNIEYLIRVADFMREEVTDKKTEEYLFEIEKLVRHKLGLCTKNIISWLELVKSSTFIEMLSRNGKEYSENLLTV